MSSPDRATREAERTVLRLFAAIVAFLLAGAALALAQREEAGSAGSPSAPPPTVAPAPGELGPPPGRSIAEYRAARARTLREATGRRSAIVSFDDYVDPAAARRLLAATEVRFLLVAVPGGRPQVTADVAAWLTEARAELESEREELLRLLPTVADPAFERQYRSDIARLGAALDALGGESSVVYGGIVVADARVLRDVARTPGVRLVDVAPDAEVPVVVRALRPEETRVAGVPATRPVTGADR